MNLDPGRSERPQRLDQVRAEEQFGHVVPIEDIDVKALDAILDPAHVLAEREQIG